MVDKEEAALIKRYSLRRVGKGYFEVSVPPEVVEREARKAGLAIDEFLDHFELECLFDAFEGLHYRFRKRTRR